jgi:pimeloyl-ACP methyl ester carboxylesterase
MSSAGASGWEPWGTSLRRAEGVFGDVTGYDPVHFIAYAPSVPGHYDAVLFLHGYDKTDEEWAYHQIGLARDGWFTVAINYDIDEYLGVQHVEVLRAIQRMLAYPEVATLSLCGASWGGKVALEVAAMHPELPIANLFLLYPFFPNTSNEEFATLHSAVITLVGEADPLVEAAKWIDQKITENNDEIFHTLHIYSRTDFGRDARHGYFFARTPSSFNEVAIDSWVRGVGLMLLNLHHLSETPEWADDPRMLRAADILEMGDMVWPDLQHDYGKRIPDTSPFVPGVAEHR